jgi:hypothetical protein
MGTPKKEGLLVALHNLRDIYIDAWARATLQITGSPSYARFSKLATQPGLIAALLARKATDAWTTQLFAQLNVPSRAEMTTLAARLARIEIVLDDLGAALDRIEAPAQRTTPRQARTGPRAVAP